MSPTPDLRRIGVVVHPARPIAGPLESLLGWGRDHGVEVVQIAVAGQERRVAPTADAEGSDLIVSIGGDGTMLAGIRAAIAAGRPAMGIACGSLGVLTAISARDVARALDRYVEADWLPRRLPALSATHDGGAETIAVNDIVVARSGIGQIRVTAYVDGVLYCRLAGDGAIVSTALGSSAYSLAAGGPLVAPGAPVFLFTPLPSHGGFRQPLVLGDASRLELEVSAGVGGSHLELDGQILPGTPSQLSITLRPDVVTLVAFSDSEPMLTGLRRRRIIADSPRVVADRERRGEDPAG